MKQILIPNPNPPYNLRQVHPNPDLLEFATEQQVVDFVVRRNKEVGVIPCESEAERTDMILQCQFRHPKLVAPDLPQVGPHYVVEDTDLPDDYFFDAWEWDGVNQKVEVNMVKARVVHRIRANIPAEVDLDQFTTLESLKGVV